MHEDYIREGIMREGKIGEADSLLIKAKEMADYTLDALKQDIRLLFAK
jgi:aminoglycoside N3'-acetyltransferase